MHREKREYLRPPDHHGPETALVGGTKRVKRGDVFVLHTSDQEHAGLLADGYRGTMMSTAASIEPERDDAQPGRATKDNSDAIPRKKKGETDA